MAKFTYCEYIVCNGVSLFTTVSLPEKAGKFPTVVYRSPYVDSEEKLSEEEICESRNNSAWLDGGYAVVYQHCRGRGKSSGDCVPYIYEREDTIALYNWIREQEFYNGELYLCGASYTSSVHLVAAPFDSDVKGAIFEVQDSERYNCNYRNGFYKMGLHGGWYVGMYKKKSNLNKSFTTDSYKTLPLSDFSRNVFGESAEDFDQILQHPDKNDEFWSTRFGGGEAHNAVSFAGIPILLVTGFYDIYTGGVFDMWRNLDDKTRSLSALVVHPFEHNGSGEKQPVNFECATVSAAFPEYKLRWFNAIRENSTLPFEPGKVTYYKLFADKWCTDDFDDGGESERITLGDGEVSYKYNPYAPASFKGGLSTNFGGNAWQDKPNSRYDIISVFSHEFDTDTYIKGKIQAKLQVKSDREDTCFYMRLSICKPEGYYGLRDDITQISVHQADYRPGDEITLSFSFDEHAFVIKKGEKLRIDISSSAYPHYVPHTNMRGLFSSQTMAVVATNTVILDKSYLEIPISKLD